MKQVAKVKRLEAVVLAVKDHEKAVSFFQDNFGIEFDDGRVWQEEGVTIRQAQIDGTRLIIESPQGSDSAFHKFIEKKGEGVHHISFEVTNIEEMVTRLKAKGIRLSSEEPKVERFDDVILKYIFIHPKSAHGVLIELTEFLNIGE